jgi:hypothetical protein
MTPAISWDDARHMAARGWHVRRLDWPLSDRLVIDGQAALRQTAAGQRHAMWDKPETGAWDASSEQAWHALNGRTWNEKRGAFA